MHDLTDDKRETEIVIATTTPIITPPYKHNPIKYAREVGHLNMHVMPLAVILKALSLPLEEQPPV